MARYVAQNLLDTEDLIRRWADAVRGEQMLSPWPRQTMLALIGKYGHGAYAINDSEQAPLGDELMDVDAAIASLEKEEKEVLTVAALYQGIEPRMLLARAMHMSLDQFNRKLGRARRRARPR
jgi:hypothetical protein